MKKKYLSNMTILLAGFILSACGGGSDQQPNTAIEHKPKTFQSNFTSSLSIEEKLNDGSKVYKIADQSSNEKDSILAYNVGTQLANTLQTHGDKGQSINYPQLMQLFHFELEKNVFDLEVSYDPILKQPYSFTVIKAASTTDPFEREFFCREDGLSFNALCVGATLDYDSITGTANISFNQSEFKSNNPSDPSFVLNGKIKGTLSIPPQTIQDIPKVSHGSVTIDGKTHQILAAMNTPRKISGSQFFNAGISVLLDSATSISFSKDNHGLYSQYTDSKVRFLTASPIDTKGLTFKDLKTSSQFTLQSTLFNFSSSGNEIIQQPITISAIVEVPLHEQTLTIRPRPPQASADDKTNPWYTSTSFFHQNITPDDFNVHTINHNTVMIEAQNIKVIIQDKKLKFIQLNTVVIDPSSSELVLVSLDYQCGDTTPACQGVTVEPNGFGVKFNNTILTNLQVETTSNFPLPPAITLNGGLIYVGR